MSQTPVAPCHTPCSREAPQPLVPLQLAAVIETMDEDASHLYPLQPPQGLCEAGVPLKTTSDTTQGNRSKSSLDAYLNDLLSKQLSGPLQRL